MRGTFFLVLAVVAVAQTQRPGIDDGRRWLEGAVANTPLEQAARSVALNQNAVAEKLLVRMRGTPEGNEAYKLLARIYLRTGRYKTATRNLEQWLQRFPNSADAQAAKSDVDKFAGLPDQSNGPRRPATLQTGDDLSAPITINGKPAKFLVDTGAFVSVVSEESAKRLGLEFRGAGKLGDSSGKGIEAKTAVAKQLQIGNMRFQNVSFFVLPDQALFQSIPVEERGIIGVPIQFAVGSWQWSQSGTVRVGDVLPPSLPNLTFFKSNLLVSAQVGGRDEFFHLDSGASSTDLNSNFLANHADLTKNAQTATREITGVGGTSTFEARILPELAILAGGRPLMLRPAEVTLQTLAGIGGECCIGNFGNDLLTQADVFIIDFDHMTLSFR